MTTMTKPTEATTQRQTTGKRLGVIRKGIEDLESVKVKVGMIWLSANKADDAPEHIEDGITDLMIQIEKLKAQLRDEYSNTVEGV